MEAKDKNYGVEAFRVFMMFIVCSYHALVNCGHNVVWLNHILLVGVVGFVVISGWYGVKFSWLKVLRLYGVAAYGAIVSGAIAGLLGDVHDAHQMLLLMLNNFRAYWFVHAYVIMMMFAPLIDIAVSEPFPHRGSAILVLVFIWSFLGEVRYVKWLVPVSAGLTQLSGYTLIGIYFAARLLRKYESRLQLIRRRSLLCAAVFGLIVSVLHFGFYQSPFQFLFAASLFMMFKKLPIGNSPKTCHILRLLTPSVFAVYVIHTNSTGIYLLKALDQILMHEMPSGIVVTFLVGIIVFFVSAVLDMPRRLLLKCGKILAKSGFIRSVLL